MKTATIFLAFLAVTGVMLWKYRAEIARLATNATSASTPVGGTWFSGAAKYLWIIGALVVFGLLYWWHQTPTTPVDVIRWGQKHWLFLLVVASACYAGLAYTAALKGAVPVLQKVLVWGVVAVLIAATPLGEWLITKALVTAATCPTAISGRARSCVVNTSATRLFTEAADTEKFGREFCVGPFDKIHLERFAGAGGTYWELRAKSDEVLVTYRLLPKCPKTSVGL